MLASHAEDFGAVGRCFDAGVVNALVNHPAIRPFVGGDLSEALDLSDAVACRRNVFLLGNHGGFALIWTAPASYEVHTFIAPSGRGSWAARAAINGISAMKDLYGARHLWTRVPQGAANVALFTRVAGMTLIGDEEFDIGAGPQMFTLYEWRA